MEYAPYKFSFKKRLNTRDLIKQHCKGLNNEDIDDYVHHIGQNLFEFEVQDRFHTYTVLKTKEQLKDFFGNRNVQARNKLVLFFFGPKKNVGLEDFMTKQNFVLNDIYDDNEGLTKEVSKFFQINDVSIKKLYSVKIERKVISQHCCSKTLNWCSKGRWDNIRAVITRQGIIQIRDHRIHDFLFFDSYFTFKSGMAETKYQFGINMTSAHRRMKIKLKNERQFLEFLYYLNEALNKKKQKMPFEASARHRDKNQVQYLVDAVEYYGRVIQEIKKAKRQIFMQGWWISPEIFLTRPVPKQKLENPKKYRQMHKGDRNYPYQLFELLDEKATQGVKINIIVFNNPPVIPLDAQHTEKMLEGLHPNIKVERHPYDIIPSGWSHHQKLVIIDYEVAFMGGFDICYGRYDSQDHPINNNSEQMYPGTDYNNARIKDFEDVRHPEKDLQSRTLPRLPWHDVALRVRGRIVGDLVNHFIQYWNWTQIEKNYIPKIKRKKQVEERGHSLKKVGSKPNINKMEENDKSPQQEQQYAKILQAILLQGNVLSEQFSQKISESMKMKRNKDLTTQVFRKIVEKDEDQLKRDQGNYLVQTIESLGIIKREEDLVYHTSEKFNTRIDSCQLLRSASVWSIGLQQGRKQRSIQNAYLTLIEQAKHFIYIENQFFISATGAKNSFVKNQIANALYKRIEKAYEDNADFKVVIFIPLMPGMPGQADKTCPLPLKLTLHWQYNTISRGGDSLIERVNKLTRNNADKYIQFFSLRQHGLLDGIPVTQLIYIHTKVMIVDDNLVICGSANVNDRSQEGDRDSELALYFQDGEKINIQMNGKKMPVNKKAHELRKKLYMEHFAITGKEAQDPISQKTNKIISKIASQNTKIYRKLFHCYPDDEISTFAENTKYKVDQPTQKQYEKVAKSIQGHAVEYPYYFLSKQNLFSLDFEAVQNIVT